MDNSLRMGKSPGLLIAGLTALSLGILGLGTWWLLKPSADGNGQASEVEVVPSTEQNVTALGRIEPAGGVHNVSAPTSAAGDSRVMQLLVREGDEIQQGQPIALMSSLPALQAAVLQANANLIEAQARLKKAEADAKSGNLAAQAANAKARELAQETQSSAAKVQRMTAAVRTKEAEIETLKSKAVQIVAEGRKAEQDWLRFQELAAGGAIADTELNSREQAVEAKVRELEQVKQSVKQAQSEKARAERQLEDEILSFRESEKQFDRSKSQVESLKGVKVEDLDVVRAQVMVAETALQRAIVERDTNGTIPAPVDGQVLKLHADSGEVVGSQGIADLGQTQAMHVIAGVDQADINKVRLGQAAVITSPVVKQPLLGRVNKVGLQVNQKGVLDLEPVAEKDARVVEVEIRLDNPEPVKTLTNLQVNVKIATNPSAFNSRIETDNAVPAKVNN